MAQTVQDTIQHLLAGHDEFRKSLNGKSANALFTNAASAKDMLQKLEVPTRKHEEWKYTSFEKILSSGLTTPDATEKDIKATDIGDVYKVHLRNGALVKHDDIPGVSISSLQHQDLPDEYGKQLPETGAYYHQLNAALLRDALVITIKKGTALEKPIHLSNQLQGDGAYGACRVLIFAEANSEATLFEENHFDNGASGFNHRLAEVWVAQNAQFKHMMLENYKADQFSLHQTYAQVQRDGNYTNHVWNFGGDMSRNDLQISLIDENCSCDLYGLYLLDNNSHVDNHTVVDHLKPNCVSNEFYKGVLKGASTGVFNGKVYVREDAQKTNAYQQNRNLLLSDNATINTKPQLEIWADDVKCSHGATVGQLDEQQLFYLQARGIGHEMARALMVFAFASEVLEKIGHEPMRNYLLDLVKTKLEFSID